MTSAVFASSAGPPLADYDLDAGGGRFHSRNSSRGPALRRRNGGKFVAITLELFAMEEYILTETS